MNEVDVRRIAEQARTTAEVVDAKLTIHLDQCAERHKESKDAFKNLESAIAKAVKNIEDSRRWRVTTAIAAIAMAIGIAALAWKVFVP